jgi:hypothetical protein
MCRPLIRVGATAARGFGQEVGLLLVVALETDAVAGPDHHLQKINEARCVDQLAAREAATSLIRDCRSRGRLSHTLVD